MSESYKIRHSNEIQIAHMAMSQNRSSTESALESIFMKHNPVQGMKRILLFSSVWRIGGGEEEFCRDLRQQVLEALANPGE